MDWEFTYCKIKVLFHLYPEIPFYPNYYQGILATAFAIVVCGVCCLWFFLFCFVMVGFVFMFYFVMFCFVLFLVCVYVCVFVCLVSLGIFSFAFFFFRSECKKADCRTFTWQALL